MSTEMVEFEKKESEKQAKFGVAIISLYGYPQKHDSEPFAAQTLKSALDSRFPNTSVETNLYILGRNQDENGQQEVNELAKNLADDKSIKIVGISIPQGTYDLAKDFLSALNNANYKGLKILGHALPTYLPEDFIRNFPDTLVIRGWGEESFCKIVEKELCNSRDYGDVPNLTYLSGQDFVNNSILWPDMFTEIDRYDVNSFFPRIEASRGCHHNSCSFCTRPLKDNMQPSWVRVSPEVVLNNIRELKEQGVSNFTFTDEDFIGNDLDGALEIIRGVDKLGNLHFALDLRADSIINPHDTPEQAEKRSLLVNLLVKSGLSLAYVGAETLSKGQLKRYSKGVTPNEEVIAINKLVSLSVPLELGLITFDPLLSIDELSENVANMRQTGLWKFGGQLFNELHVFEGNPYCSLLKRNNLNLSFNPDYLTYAYKYLNADVESIRNICIPFKNSVDYVYTSVRNIFRTSFDTPEFVNEFLYHYRENELIMLEDLLKNPGDSEKVLKDVYKRLRFGADKLKREMLQSGVNDDPRYSEAAINLSKYLQ